MKWVKLKSDLAERGIAFFFAMCLFLFLSVSTEAQDRVSIQFRPGVSFATTALFDADLKVGFGFEGSVAYRFMPHVGAYAGWGWNRFSASQSFAGADMDFEETGYTLGLQFIHAFSRDMPFEYFARAGVIINHIEIENSQGEMIADSGHGTGFQVETGLSFSLGETFRIMPGIKYQSLSREIDLEGIRYPLDLNYLSGGVSVSWTFR